MKILFEGEDTVLGIVLGVLLIAQSEKYFSFSFSYQLLYLFVPLVFAFAVLDVVHHLSHLFMNFAPYLIIQVHNAANLLLLVGMGTVLFGYSLPLASGVGQWVFASPQNIFLAGAYFGVSYLIHMIYEKVIGA